MHPFRHPSVAYKNTPRANTPRPRPCGRRTAAAAHDGPRYSAPMDRATRASRQPLRPSLFQRAVGHVCEGVYSRLGLIPSDRA